MGVRSAQKNSDRIVYGNYQADITDNAGPWCNSDPAQAAFQ